jgi:hypothetical protein
MFQPQNPFLQSMTRMKLPDNMGRSVSIATFNVEADEEGCIEVPAQFVNELQCHGLTIVAPKVAKAA